MFSQGDLGHSRTRSRSRSRVPRWPHDEGRTTTHALTTFASLASILGLVLTTSAASASSPAGVCADVEKVAYEPNAGDVSTATRVVIHDVFVKSNGGFPAVYAEPVRGYLYYECPRHRRRRQRHLDGSPARLPSR